MALFHSLPIDLQRSIFIDFIGNQTWEAWKTIAQFDTAHTNALHRSNLLQGFFPNLKMIWIYGSSISTKLCELHEKNTHHHHDQEDKEEEDTIILMIDWIMKRHIPISKLHVTWKLFFKLFQYPHSLINTTSFINTECLDIGRYQLNESDIISSFSSFTYVQSNIFPNLHTVEFIDTFGTYYENHLLFLTYVSHNTLQLLSLHHIEISNPHILLTILTNQRYSLRDLTIPIVTNINHISILQHLISHPLSNSNVSILPIVITLRY
jgi:hypothetical protein